MFFHTLGRKHVSYNCVVKLYHFCSSQMSHGIPIYSVQEVRLFFMRTTGFPGSSSLQHVPVLPLLFLLLPALVFARGVK